MKQRPYSKTGRAAPAIFLAAPMIRAARACPFGVRL
jgi:hypothetical protein